MKKYFILLILLAFAIPANGATIYKWVDEKGVVNFTDDHDKIPPVLRNRVETKEYLEREPPSSPSIKEEVNTDAHGRDYWKKELDEATMNYERVREELLNAGERLVWYRYGGKTQYQMFTADLPGITDRLEAYRKQMIEAKAMVETFNNEAQETEGAGRRGEISLRTDIYGRGETWWKEKVRSLKEQLKEATQNYDEACETTVRQLEGLGPFRWGGLSLTQYQMISSRLTELYDRISKYQAEISETKSMLAKLYTEASEAKADLAWLE